MAVWTRTELPEIIQSWKSGGQRVVFTNGCFDILHKGHETLLEKASAEGDRLIVGLNSDASVRRLKGLDRPVNPESKRAASLDALEWVTGVVLFEEDTPAQLIRELNPDVLVKGGDYTEETIVGSNHVKSNGGTIVIIPLVEGFSTTGILEVKQREKS